MALTTLNLTVDLYSNDTCSQLILDDTTGLYSVNNLNGYGSPNGIYVNNVTTLVMTLNYTTLSAAAIYTFTIANGVITAATLNFAGIGSGNILTLITNTTWPFAYGNEFYFLNSYTPTAGSLTTLPALEDGAYSVSYEITGNALDIATSTAFDLTSTKMILMDCNIACCINDAFSKVPADCNCDDNLLTNTITAEAYWTIAQIAVGNNDSTRANLFINKAKTYCDCDCGCH